MAARPPIIVDSDGMEYDPSTHCTDYAMNRDGNDPGWKDRNTVPQGDTDRETDNDSR